jgi:general secretion pathway protein J
MWIEIKKRFGLINPAGFTLLEILAAIFIFSIVMGLVFGTFGGVFSSADRVSAASDLYEMASASMGRMTTDLKAIHITQPPRYKAPDLDSEPDIYRVEGRAEYMGGQSVATIRFTSLAHLPIGRNPREGITRIVYYVQDTQDDGYVLRRSDAPFPFQPFEPSSTDPVLCEQVIAFKVVYYDKEGRESEEWNSESDLYEYSTPQAVGIELTIGSEQMSYTFATEVALPMVRSISRRR